MNTKPATPAAPGRVLVTGATGLLGSNVTAELLAAGTEVLALARDAGRARSLLPAHERLRILQGDITRTGGFAAQLRGVDAIVHTAAWFREYYQPGGNDQTGPALVIHQQLHYGSAPSHAEITEIVDRVLLPALGASAPA